MVTNLLFTTKHYNYYITLKFYFHILVSFLGQKYLCIFILSWNEGIILTPGPRCIKLTINGKYNFNGNFHRILDADWLWCLVAMVVTIESKVTIDGKFYATGPRCSIKLESKDKTWFKVTRPWWILVNACTSRRGWLTWACRRWSLRGAWWRCGLAWSRSAAGWRSPALPARHP